MKVVLFVFHALYASLFLAFWVNPPYQGNPFLLAFFFWSLVVVFGVMLTETETRGDEGE